MAHRHLCWRTKVVSWNAVFVIVLGLSLWWGQMAMPMRVHEVVVAQYAGKGSPNHGVTEYLMQERHSVINVIAGILALTENGLRISKDLYMKVCPHWEVQFQIALPNESTHLRVIEQEVLQQPHGEFLFPIPFAYNFCKF